jgi:SAM-dependent methyltransferase
MDAERVDQGLVHTLLPAADIDTLEAVGLLTADAVEAGTYRSTALLYPTGSFYITSDRTPEPDEPSRPADIVFSAISESTRRFLAAVPFAPCENFLELCAGTGIAALGAARQAGHAWAADISARATHFAQFNGLLNEVDNFTAVRGDLFEAVPDQSFDRICAHPPYMPALEQECLYRDGGQDGEQITSRIVAGLPTYLREGGRFYCHCLASDRQNSPAEQRFRDMLGGAAREFDVVVVALQEYPPAEYYSHLLASKDVSAVRAEGHVAVLERLGVRQLIFCSIVIQRTRRPRAVFTVRRQSGEATGHREMDWLLRRETALLECGSAGWILAARPMAFPHAHLHVAHQLGENAWTHTECSLPTEALSFDESSSLQGLREEETGRPVEGGDFIADREVLTFCQLFGSDYVDFHYRSALENLAAAYSRELGLVIEERPTLLAAFRRREGLALEESFANWLNARCLSSSELEAHLAEEACVRALLKRARSGGDDKGPDEVALEALVAEYGVFRAIFGSRDSVPAWVREWLTPEEDSQLEDQQKLAKLAVRTFCTSRGVPWRAPLIRRLKFRGSFRVALQGVASARMVQQMLEPSLPPRTIERLAPRGLLRRSRERWGLGGDRDPALALLDRGFASQDEFTTSARPYYLYDKVMGSGAAFSVGAMQVIDRSQIPRNVSARSSDG